MQKRMGNKASNLMGKHRLLISRKVVLVALLVILVCTIAEVATRSG